MIYFFFCSQFNFNKCCIWIIDFLIKYKKPRAFNFNKCCIWICRCDCGNEKDIYLTLTNVVFELQSDYLLQCTYHYLTLTNVVFECGNYKWYHACCNYLTLTNVVFECQCGLIMNTTVYNLTLTNVVFEYFYWLSSTNALFNLTLTNVVFEFVILFYDWFSFWFNFNKCCIWILSGHHGLVSNLYLTLTNVVFESNYMVKKKRNAFYLTLTNVVFELLSTFGNVRIFIFNFNKCCIWIFFDYSIN